MLKKLSVVAANANSGATPAVAGPPPPVVETTETGVGTDTLGPKLNLQRGSTAGPSLAGLMISRKFAKRLSTKANSKRDITSASGIHKMEPTYRMEPKRPFRSCVVEKCMKDILDSRLQNFKYNPKFCANMIKILTDEIKERVKVFCFDRYKIVCIVTLAQKNDQGLMMGSRSSWDKKNDNFACYTFTNQHIVCTATVYGIYRE